jgi:hypothetical protein
MPPVRGTAAFDGDYGLARPKVVRGDVRNQPTPGYSFPSRLITSGDAVPWAAGVAHKR